MDIQLQHGQPFVYECKRVVINDCQACDGTGDIEVGRGVLRSAQAVMEAV